MYEGEGAGHAIDEDHFQNFQVYIGESTDYTQNPKCPGGPFLQKSDPNSMSYDDFENKLIWNYGAEIWCNMKGRYTHIVADLNHLSASPYEMSICNLGVMGTRFERTTPLSTTELTVQQDSVTVLRIPHVPSVYKIGDDVFINLRHQTGQ